MSYKTVIKKFMKCSLPVWVETQSLVANDETVRKDITSEAVFVNSVEVDEPEIIFKEQEKNA